MVSASEDESQIRSVLLRERYYRDTCRWDSMRALYHPESCKTWVNITWYSGEIDGFIDGSRAVSHGKVNTVHNLFCSEIEVNGTKAISECFCNITSRFEHEGIEFDKITTCRLISRLNKLTDANRMGNPWKMLTLEPIYIRDSFVPAAPISPDKVPTFEGLDTFPKAYRHGAWLLASIGLESRTDLPAEDNREVVQEMLKCNKEWLGTPS